MKTEIPVMYCFDNNYVIPAAVAFYSLLENSSKNYYYKFYVLHSDITEENRKKLLETIKPFSSFSSLEFIDMSNRFNKLWERVKIKGHFSKEVMYKVLVASIFPQYDKLIVSDVDVVFLGDISESYINFNVNEEYYLAGVKAVGKIIHYMNNYKKNFDDEEIEKLSQFCGGYLVFNLKKLRQDKMEEKFISCFEEEGYRINQMEQDVLNLCCYPKTKRLNLKYVTCSYMWDLYKNESDFENDANYSKKELKDAMSDPIQLHYATSIKPWKKIDCTKSEEWFKYIVKTPFLKEFLSNISKNYDFVKPKAELKTYKILKFEKYIKVVVKYIKRNPLFLFKSKFYEKLYKTILKKIFKINNNDLSLLIIDDSFPSISSPFRYAEFMGYFDNINDVNSILVPYNGLPNIISKEQKESVAEFLSINPEFSNKVLTSFNYEKKVKLAVLVFLNNAYANLNFLEKRKIPFVFTLYPGGGFSLGDKESDEKLKKICESNYFKKVIVTQQITYDYLINNNFCKKDKICYINGGIIINKKIQKNIKVNRYGINKEYLDVCFVAHKYTKNGTDKGYDKFIETAKEVLKKNKNIKFHVVGEFDEKDLDVDVIKNNIKFYGIHETKWFERFYSNMDIILSPNKPFVLSKGSFDGFPTTSALEAMFHKVALFCTDELKLNENFIDGKDIIIINLTSKDIANKILYYYDNPKKLISIEKNGNKKVRKYYSYRNQILKRVKIVKNLIKKGR